MRGIKRTVNKHMISYRRRKKGIFKWVAISTQVAAAFS
jgi:hypothetical protein